MKKYILIALIVAMTGVSSCSLDEPDGLSYEERLALFEEQLEDDIDAIDAYLVENEIDAIEHESGIRYVMTEEGDGEVPVTSDLVKVKYEGRLFNGTVFDESYSKDPDWVVFPLNTLIAAWQVAIPLMKEGGKMTLYAPSGFCYGDRPNGSIPANSNLMFDIELVEIVVAN